MKQLLRTAKPEFLLLLPNYSLCCRLLSGGSRLPILYSGGLSWFTIITRDKFHKTTQLWCSVGIILQTKASLMLLF